MSRKNRIRIFVFVSLCGLGLVLVPLLCAHGQDPQKIPPSKNVRPTVISATALDKQAANIAAAPSEGKENPVVKSPASSEIAPGAKESGQLAYPFEPERRGQGLSLPLLAAFLVVLAGFGAILYFLRRMNAKLDHMHQRLNDYLRSGRDVRPDRGDKLTSPSNKLDLLIKNGSREAKDESRPQEFPQIARDIYLRSQDPLVPGNAGDAAGLVSPYNKGLRDPEAQAALQRQDLWIKNGSREGKDESRPQEFPQIARDTYLRSHEPPALAFTGDVAEMVSLYNGGLRDAEGQEAFQKRFRTVHFELKNFNERLRNTEIGPIFEEHDNGVFLAIEKPVGGRREVLVFPRFRLILNDSLLGPGAFGLLFDCLNYDKQRKYARFRLIEPATLVSEMVDWRMSRKGKIDLGSGD